MFVTFFLTNFVFNIALFLTKIIQLLEDNGTILPENVAKHIEENIWELRPGNNRIFYFYYADNTFILLHSFRKKTQRDMEEIEEQAAIISAVIQQRHALGVSQRELANLCGIPQSSVARIESLKTTPNLDTLLKIMRPLGLKLTVLK